MSRPQHPYTALLATVILALSMLTGLVTANGTTEPAGPQAVPTGESILPEDFVLSAMAGGNTVGAPIREAQPRADGFRHIDTPAMIERLEQMHATTYSFGVWDMETDWDDLRLEFAPAAAEAGIDVMVYIVPPSECWLNDERHLDGRCSRPFNMDYVAWAEAIAELSVEYPNVKSWGIDDFLVGSNADLFTPEYLQQVRDAQDAINPDLKWYVTLYYYEINPTNMAKIDGILDGVIYPYNGYNNNTIDSTWLETRLDGALETLEPYSLELVLLVYNGRFLDGIIHPDERYAAEILDRAEPYVADGLITGIIAYAAPVRLELHQPSWDYWGRTGNGSLSLSVSNFTATSADSYAAASQQIKVDPDAPAKTLTFHHYDQYGPGDLNGYQFAQVLVDDEVIWDQDTTTDPKGTWIETELDLTEALSGKSEATVTFRLFHKIGVGWWPLDLRIDDVTGEGIIVANGGFESTEGWELDRNQPTMQPYIDIYYPDRPTRVFNAIGAGYARYQGEEFAPVDGAAWPSLRISPENRAMYGNGRLEFTVPAGVNVPANTCASASQTMTVDPDYARYEINFWHADPYQVGRSGNYFKQVAIDGEVLWNRDISDWWPWFYMQGSEHQGVIDVTEFVEGKESVEFEFRLCTLDNSANDIDVHYGVDAFETIGLDVANGGFEGDYGWDLESSDPISVAIDVHGPCEAPDATVISGVHDGRLTVSGTTCLQDAEVTGPVTVAAGGSLYTAGGTIDGPLWASKAATVVVRGTTIGGAVDIARSTDEVRVEDATTAGPLRVTRNDTGQAPIVIAGNSVGGPLACSRNTPAPVNGGIDNDVDGPSSGQCRDL